MSLSFLVSTALASVMLLGGIVGYLSDRKSSRQREAAETWRNITHRGGVTAVSPWHSATSRYNAPGLVRVYPQSQKPEPTSASVPTPVRPERPAPSPIEKPADESDSADSETVELPLELTDEPNETEKEAVLLQLEKGLSQSKTILTVWGVKSGGSTKYKAARERFQHYRDEAAADV